MLGLPAPASVLIAVGLFAAATALSFKSAARALVGEKERRTADKNRERIETAARTLDRLKTIRFSDAALKQKLGMLCFEADSYIASALKDPDCQYDPRALAELDNALAAVTAFQRQSNQSAMAGAFGAADEGGSDGFAAELLAALQTGVEAFKNAGV
jgi:hypothetical protein